MAKRDYKNCGKPKKDYEGLNEKIDDIVEFYYINNRIPIEDFESKLCEKCVELLQWAKKTVVFYHKQDYTELNKKFDRYIWHFENISFNNLDVFKVIGYLSRIIDDDEYFFD